MNYRVVAESASKKKRSDSLSELSAVVPFRNVEKMRGSILDSWDFSRGRLVLVDDGSSDQSRAEIKRRLIELPNWVMLGSENSYGAGLARNAGLSEVTEGYVTFLDYDDLLDWTQLWTALLRLTDSPSDLVIFAYQQITNSSEGPSGMWPRDQQLFQKLLADEEAKLIEANRLHLLLRYTNYPFTKIVKVDLLRDVRGMLFGGTQIHNDVWGHWQTILASKMALVTHDCPITHVRRPGSITVSNRADKVPEIFEMLVGLERILRSLSASPRLVQEYWAFVRDIYFFNRNRLLSEGKPDTQLDRGLSELIREYFDLEAASQMVVTTPDLSLFKWLAGKI